MIVLMAITFCVITPSAKAAFLPDCLRCVAEQTVRPQFHLIGKDYKGGLSRGQMVPIRNALVSTAAELGCDWVSFNDDDDLLDKNHFELLTKAIDDDVDIVYSWAYENKPRQLNRPFDGTTKYVTSNFMIRTGVFSQLGGFNQVKHEEWDFWQRAIDAGVGIKCIEKETWNYRWRETRL